MREDPIIHEDWEPGLANRKLYRQCAYFNAALTFIILFLGLIQSLNELARLLVFFLTLVISLYLEAFATHFKKSVFTRLLPLGFIVILLVIFPYQNILGFTITNILIGLLIFAKILLFPLLVNLNDVYGEILWPKNEKIREKLAYQLSSLSVTEYAISNKNLRKTRDRYIFHIFFRFLIIFAITTPLFVIPLLIGERAKFYLRIQSYLLLIGASLLISVFFLGPFLYSFQEKRKKKKVKKQKEAKLLLDSKNSSSNLQN